MKYLVPVPLLFVVFFAVQCVKGPTVVDPVDRAPVSAVVINANNFDSLVAKPGVVALVEFYQPGCQICNGLMWVIDSLAVTLSDSALLGTVNIDSNPTLNPRFGITTVPTYLFFKDGVVVTKRSFSVLDLTAFDTLSGVLRKIIAGTITVPRIDTIHMRDTTRVIDTIHVRDTTHVIDTICAIDTTHLRSAAPVNARVIRENNFDSLVTSIGSIALVKFYQPGSAVCRSLMWVIDTLATTFKDSACIGAVNVDSNAALCQRFNVTTVPSYLFLKNGAVVSRRSFLTDDSTAFDTVSAVLRGLIAETRIPPGVVVLDTSNLQHMIGVYGRISMVHFFSPMCGACQVMAPVVDNLATRYGGTALIGKTDIIKYPVFLSGLMYNIRSYPTSIFFDGGTEYARIVGVVSVDSLASVVDRGLAR